MNILFAYTSMYAFLLCYLTLFHSLLLFPFRTKSNCILLSNTCYTHLFNDMDNLIAPGCYSFISFVSLFAGHYILFGLFFYLFIIFVSCVFVWFVAFVVHDWGNIEGIAAEPSGWVGCLCAIKLDNLNSEEQNANISDKKKSIFDDGTSI